MARDGNAVDRGDVQRAAGGVAARRARAREALLRAAALEGGDAEAEAGVGEVLHPREDPLVDLAGLDVATPAPVDLEPRVGEDLALELLLRGEERLGHAGVRVERVLPGGAVDRRVLE